MLPQLGFSRAIKLAQAVRPTFRIPGRDLCCAFCTCGLDELADSLIHFSDDGEAFCSDDCRRDAAAEAWENKAYGELAPEYPD